MNLVKKIFSILFFYVFSYLLQFVLQIIIGKYYGPQGTGYYSVINTIISLLYALSNLGLTNALIHNQSKFGSDKKNYGIAVISSVTLGIISSLLLFYNFELISRLIFKSEVNQNVKYIIAFVFPFYLFNIFFSNLCLSENRIFSYNISKFIPPLISILIILSLKIFIKSENIISLLFIITNFLLFLFYLISNFKLISLKLNNLIVKFKQLIKYGISGYLADLLNFFSYRGDILILATFTNLITVGLYTLSVTLGELLFILPTSIGLILFPFYSNKKNQDEKYIFMFSKITLYLLIISSILLIFFAKYFILYFFGNKFNLSFTLFLYLLPGTFFMSLTKIISSFFMGIGKPYITLIISLITVSFTLSLDIMLIPIYSAYGAVYASVIGYFVSYLLTLFYFKKYSYTSLSQLFLFNKDDLNIIINIIKNKS